nr:hypothetical protein [Actinomyces sp. 2119]
MVTQRINRPGRYPTVTPVARVAVTARLLMVPRWFTTTSIRLWLPIRS